MIITKIYTDENEVHRKLEEFRFTVDEIQEIGRKIQTERNSTTPHDIVGAESHLSYFYGTRFTADLGAEKNYTIKKDNNVSSIIDPENNREIIYTNVDEAGNPRKSPRAISRKGNHTIKKLEAQGELFLNDDYPEAIHPTLTTQLNNTIWILGFSFNEDSFSAELSLPISMSHGNYKGFIERIIIQDGDVWIGRPAETLPEDYANLEPQITRR